MRRLSGITILELLISLVIGAAMLTLLAPMMRNAGTGLRQAEAQAERVQSVILRGHLRRAFRGVESSGREGAAFSGGPVQMTFVSAFSPAAVPEATGQRVTLSLQSGTISASFTTLEENGEKVGQVLSLEAETAGEARLQIRYLPACDQTGWVAEWDASTPPRAVEITGEDPNWPLYLIDRPLRAGESC